MTPANEEFVSSAQWFESKSTGLGIEFIDLVEEKYACLRNDPQMFPLWEMNDTDAEIRRVLLPRFQYVIYYQITHDQRIFVLSICHGSRDPSSWIDRVVKTSL